VAQSYGLGLLALLGGKKGACTKLLKEEGGGHPKKRGWGGQKEKLPEKWGSGDSGLKGLVAKFQAGGRR